MFIIYLLHMFTRNELFLLSSLAIAKFTHILDFMIMMPLGVSLMKEFGISAQEFGILVSSYGLSAGATAIVSAFFIDRFDRKRILLLLYGGFILGTLLCAMSNSYWSLLIARSATGMFGGLLNTIILSIVADTFELKKRATATGIVMSGMSAAAAFGVPLGLFFATAFVWQVPFYAIIVLAIPIWFGLRTFVPLSPDKEKFSPTIQKTLSNVFGNWNQIRALFLSACMILGQFMLIPYISPYMVKNIGFSEFQLIYIYLIGGSVSLITSPIIGRLADKYGHKKVFLWVALGSCIPILAITHLPTVPIYVALFFTTLFFIFIGGRAVPAMTMIVSSASPDYRGSFMSFNTAFQQLAAGAAALISGMLIVETETSFTQYNFVGYLAVGLTFIGMLLASRLYPAVVAKPTE